MGCDDDGLGTRVAACRLNGGGTNRETVIECYDKVALRPGAVLQPDVQYVVSPSGVGRDALAVGVRFVRAL